MQQLMDTKYALEALLAEIGTTLPGEFVRRMLKISTPYTSIAKVNGIYYNGRSTISDMFETIVYHSGHGSSVEEIKEEMQRLINNFEIFEALPIMNRKTHGMELA